MANRGKGLITGFASYDSLLLKLCDIGSGERDTLISFRSDVASLKYSSSLVLTFDWIFLNAETLLVSVGLSNGAVELYTMEVGRVKWLIFPLP